MKNHILTLVFSLASIPALAENIVWAEHECESKTSISMVKYFCEQERQILNGLINLQMREFASAKTVDELKKVISNKLGWRSAAGLCAITKSTLEEQVACIKNHITIIYPHTIPEVSIDLTLDEEAKQNTKNIVESMKSEAYKCLYENIYKLDDGISSADVVAKGASSLCLSAANDYTFAVGETLIIDDFVDSVNISLEQSRTLAAKMVGGDRAVSAVLEVRALKKEEMIRKMQEQQDAERKKQEKKKKKVVNG